ncbi:MAG: hypothetical protein A3I01_13660 [Betaproteobacteria bacterium RIFCSPLOWO2_02_FULL_65_24]|nr:MAG: hypothetical protein A3I01_13660 [Betaproteobacteria bacterium RIFCSPLOWO2_02_FULL_65_24]
MHYEVVSPVGEDHVHPQSAGAAPLADLKSSKLGLVWTVFTNGNILLHAFRDLLAERYPDMRCVELPPGRNVRWGDHPEQNIGAFAREQGIDAAIVTAGC